MNVGMLWFDNDPKTDIQSKVERAVSYYQHKYGQAPTVCFVHPSMLPSPESVKAPLNASPQKMLSNGVEIRPNRSVLPNHFWIGINHTA